jgi:starch synthase
MRDGQPPLVHAVGGLRDTVRSGENGFAFSGANHAEKVEGFLAALNEALRILRRDKSAWRLIRSNAARERFSWADSADRYIEEAYLGPT